MSTFLHDIAKPSLSPKSAKKIHLHPVWPENFPFFFSFFLFLFPFSFLWPTKIILKLLPANLSTTTNQLSVTSVLILVQTKWFGKPCRSVVQGDEVGTNLFFFMSVDFLIHSDQYANTWSMEVLIRRVTCKSLFSFWRQKKSFKLRNLPSRTSTLFRSRRSACPFLNYDQVSKVLKKLSGTFNT